MRSTATVSTRPRYGLLDVIGLLFRELVLMIAIFFVVFAIGTAAVLTIKKTYTAGATIYAGAGQEYVYQSRVGVVTERPSPPTPGEIAGIEAQIIGSREVKLRAVRSLGMSVFHKKPSTDPMAKQEGDAIKQINDSLTIGTTPTSGAISLAYESDNAEKSAKVLAAIITAYKGYRREVFQDGSTSAIDDQRNAFEDELTDVDEAYERFLASNDIGDFATAKASAAATYQTTFTDRLSTQAQLSQAARRVETITSQLSSVPAEIVLQQDLNIAAQDRILTLRTEREALLSRYQPDSQPVKDKEAEIAAMQTYVAGGDTVGAKEVRTGPNPSWVALDTARTTAEADRDALAARLAVLDGQLSQLRERQARLTRLESENTILAGNRDNLTASIREFQQRGSQNRADNDLVRSGADNIRVLDEPAAPTRGSSLKAPLLALVFLFAGFTALCVGLLRVFSRRGFITPASAGRTLDMPVLAVAPMKA
ncbi:GumC family protein [soil metagenome]